jgi:rhodanese-related sulfurtransferase
LKFVIDNIFMIIVALVSGAMLLWPLVARRGAGPMVDTLQATRMINDENAVVVDVRDATEFAAGHLPNARNLPAAEVDKRAADLPANKPLIVVCGSGTRAGRAAAALRGAGRERVFCLDGGLAAWRQAGLPVVK